MLSVGMNVLRELEFAVYQCEECAKEDGDCDRSKHFKPGINALDQAVAFYYGTDDNFYHNLANTRCANFGTCLGENKFNGEAKVNDKVFGYFDHMQDQLQNGNCAGARITVDEITKQMWVPLIQGNLRFAWMLSDQNPNSFISSKGHQATGAIYAAGILPIIYECNKHSAHIIQQNMRVRETSVVDDFPAIKEAFESCYDFLGVTCEDVGGHKHHDKDEYASPMTMPCNDDERKAKMAAATSSSDDSSAGGKGFKIVVVLLLLLALIGAGVYFLRKKKTSPPPQSPTSESVPPTVPVEAQVV